MVFVNKKYPPGGGYFLLQALLLSHFCYVGGKGLAVNTLTVLRAALMSTYLDHIKAAVVGSLTVIHTFLNGTLDAFVCFAVIFFHNVLHSADSGFFCRDPDTEVSLI